MKLIRWYVACNLTGRSLVPEQTLQTRLRRGVEETVHSRPSLANYYLGVAD